ncbi:anti-sigma factor family protein [Paenibacillus crassostreae]|uniref:Putative zinc-finger domain-containing protein n=1 Tax=Paenibacillus crassostreae TaxID=1763538 RepID=A0A167C1J6_9BACL|nr:zf-HC2 domain-containing protein [Paenibacillus crassostreae]AOZ91757.1 hypothetical protein LPB68_05665 [Paenibacillus crassostreae]OAB72670.1 hypothetical protein PNBC_14585 [Paenibacillus crassostreae]
MSCSDMVESMHRYLDNDLSVDEEAKMLGHIANCQRCADDFRILKALSHELEELPHVVPKYSLVDAIMPQLDAIDRARHEKSSSAEQQASEMIPVVPINIHKKRFFNTSISRTLIGTAAAVGIIGVAIFTYSPQQLSDAQIGYQEKVPANAESTVSSDDRSMKTAAENGTENMADDEIFSTGIVDEILTPTDDKGSLEQETYAMESTNPELDTDADKVQSSESSGNINEKESPDSLKQDTSQMRSDEANPSTDEVKEQPMQEMSKKTQPEQSDLLKNDADTVKKEEAPLAEDSIAPKMDTVPKNSRIMSDISEFGLQADTPTATASIPLTWDSPDGTMTAVLENHLDNQKLVIYRLPTETESEKTVIQSVDLAGTWIEGVWSTDSTVFTYQVELNGKVSIHSYPNADKSITTP